MAFRYRTRPARLLAYAPAAPGEASETREASTPAAISHGRSVKVTFYRIDPAESHIL